MQTPTKFTIGVFIAAGIFLAGYYANRGTVPASSKSPSILRYACPMHPQYTSDRPGDCPSCGMRLTLANQSESETAGVPGLVHVRAEKQQLIGVRTEQVREAAASQLLRLPGRVAVDEARSYRLIAGAEGWIRDLGQNSPGAFVKKSQILASYYTPNLIAATQTFVFALQTNAQAQSGDATIGYQRGTTVLSLQVALDSLRSLGMSEVQIEEIRQTRVAPSKIHVYSPIDGFVTARNISPEQRFEKGTEMYRIADIGHVWVITDVFEKDSQFLKPGTTATIRYRGREFRARMSDALPQLDPLSRTLKARFELDNPGFALRPDTFVDVEVHVDMPAAVTVPADAIVDSGRRKTVFVERGDGMFEPRIIETGWRLGDRVQVTKGLEAGERVVISGNFLLDSESRMKTAAVGGPVAAADHAPPQKDPVCGMDVDPKGPKAITAQREGRAWYFCSEDCRRAFEANPGKYAGKKLAATDAGAMRGNE